MSKRKLLLAAAKGNIDEALYLKSRMQNEEKPPVFIGYRTPVNLEDRQSPEYKKYLEYITAEKAKHPEGTQFFEIRVVKRERIPPKPFK